MCWAEGKVDQGFHSDFGFFDIEIPSDDSSGIIVKESSVGRADRK